MAIFFLLNFVKSKRKASATVTDFKAIFFKFFADFHQLRWSYAKQAGLCGLHFKENKLNGTFFL